MLLVRRGVQLMEEHIDEDKMLLVRGGAQK